MTHGIVLFGKSYRDDVLRARQLAQSIERFNADELPFYLSVPASDVELFQQYCAGLPIEFLTDEELIAANPQLDREAFARLPGGIAQQIVKADFWRLGKADNYLCLDSDCYFIRPFRASDFLAPDGTPYTVMHEAKELLHFAELTGMTQIARNRERGCEEIKRLFGRQGRLWDFGPVPVIWSGRVWKELDERYLQPKGMTILDAINLHPAELRWYGEALLAYKSIPLLPIEPIFRCYHYEEQYHLYRIIGENEAVVARNFFGVCMQSNWNKKLDLTKKFKFSKFRRVMKRWLRP